MRNSRTGSGNLASFSSRCLSVLPKNVAGANSSAFEILLNCPRSDSTAVPVFSRSSVTASTLTPSSVMSTTKPVSSANSRRNAWRKSPSRPVLSLNTDSVGSTAGKSSSSAESGSSDSPRTIAVTTSDSRPRRNRTNIGGDSGGTGKPIYRRGHMRARRKAKTEES